MTLDKEIFLALLTFVCTLVSGYMLYKSNISKDKVKTHVETLEAEGELREELREIATECKEELERTSEENFKLKTEIHSLKIAFKDLNMLFALKIDKIKVLENFLSHLIVPAWVRMLDENNKYKFVFVNFSFCHYFDVSREYCLGQTDHEFLNQNIQGDMSDVFDMVIQRKIGVRKLIKIKDVDWTLLKFPIIEDGYIIGIGGMLINCREG